MTMEPPIWESIIIYPDKYIMIVFRTYLNWWSQTSGWPRTAPQLVGGCSQVWNCRLLRTEGFFGWFLAYLWKMWLVGGFKHVLFSIIHRNFIIPTDELHHFSEGQGSTTNQMSSFPLTNSYFSRWAHCTTNQVGSMVTSWPILSMKNAGFSWDFLVI